MFTTGVDASTTLNLNFISPWLVNGELRGLFRIEGIGIGFNRRNFPTIKNILRRSSCPNRRSESSARPMSSLNRTITLISSRLSAGKTLLRVLESLIFFHFFVHLPYYFFSPNTGFLKLRFLLFGVMFLLMPSLILLEHMWLLIKPLTDAHEFTLSTDPSKNKVCG